MQIADIRSQYELLDASDGERLERWGKYLLVRPDPQVIWKNSRASALWEKADAVYLRSASGGGEWRVKNPDMPHAWKVSFGEFVFLVKQMGFKHTGVFPEQAVNWEWTGARIRGAGRKIKLLNLFAYTGCASVAAAAAGASVCHVDASKGMVQHAKENAALSGIPAGSIRYIVDDCVKFARREIRRGNRYDAILLDPPSYGRGPSGELWRLEDNIGELLNLCEQLLSDHPLFLLLNTYTAGLAPSAMAYLLELAVGKKRGGAVTADEVGIPVKESGLALPCGACARWFV